MAAAQKQANCRVLHFGDKWWSISLHIDPDQLRMCYEEDHGTSEKNRWFHAIERLLGIAKEIYMETGVQQMLARKLIREKVSNAMQERYGDYLDRYPFKFADLVFVFDAVTLRTEEPGHPLYFTDRVMI